MDLTRDRIVRAAIELHTSVGPARTSLTAVAERAGVSRPTLYAHFPDKRSLFAACSQEATSADPWPDAAMWRPIKDPVARLRHGLGELYAYYRRNEQLTANVLRDLDFMPLIPGRDMAATLAPLREALASGWRVGPKRQAVFLATIDHALDFGSWRSFAHPHHIDDTEIVELMVILVEAATRRR
jgi:AcrR family transcriptional regulator